MFIKKKLFLGLIFILCGVSFIGCSAFNNEPDYKLPVVISSGSDCVIIYSQSSSDYVMRQAKGLGTQIEEYCNSFVTVDSDWHSTVTENKNVNKVEILFGKTNRPESVEVYNELPENGYIIKEVDGKVVIAATSEKLLRSASKRFMKEYNSLNMGINVPVGAEIVESNFSFFNIAYNGNSDKCIVIPDDTSEDIKNLAEYAANVINDKCGTKIPVIPKSKSNALNGAIIITTGTSEGAGQSSISYKDGNLIIKGNDDYSTVNAISLFIDHIVHSCDKKSDGLYHVYFPTDEVISDEWDYAIPIFPGGTFFGAETITAGSYNLIFTDSTEADYRNYVGILKILGYIPYSSTESSDFASVSLKDDKSDVIISITKSKNKVNILLSGNSVIK